MSEQVGSVTRKKSSDFHGGIRFQSSFTIRWEIEDKTFLKIDIINFVLFSNSVTFRKPRGTDLVTASEFIPGFCRSKSNVPTPGSLRTIKSPTGGQSQASNPRPLPALPPHGIYIDKVHNSNHDKFSFLSNTTVAEIFPNVCLWQCSLCSNLGGIDPEKLY